LIDPDLLEHIYDVVLGRSSWDEIMARLRVGFHAEAGLMVAYGRGPMAFETLCWSGHDASVVRLYRERYGALNPYIEAMRTGAMPPGRVVFGDDLIPEKALRATEFYQDWFRPNGMRYALGGHVQSRGGLALMVGMPRSRAAGPYLPDEVRTIQAYFGHIWRALEIQDELATRTAALDLDRIAARFQLTPAESRLLGLLAETGSLKKSAERAGRSYLTLRAQLRAVFEKTATHSQTDLMGLIHRAPVD
jgi:DNA-binding CsgD family transcriptional regulator